MTQSTDTSHPHAPEITFADFPVHPEIISALAEWGIIHPFPIQAMTLPVALSGHDIIGQAKTGTGKTLGFGVPMLNSVVAPGDAGFDALPRPGKPQALAVAPTRELAVQVSGDLERAGRHRGIRVLTVYGGRAYEPQVDALRRGVEVVVGTPGRLIDLAKQGHLDLSQAKVVVLDEADEMLDLGFLPDVETLMSLTPASRQTMLFSATMPGAIVTLARRYMTQPTHIRAMGDENENAHTVKAVEQFVYRAHALDKVEMLSRMLQAKDRGLTIIFSRTKRTAAKVADELGERGFAAAAIHGDLGQGAREQALRAFRNGKVDVLVATDVAARGIDVDNVTHVINFQCPEDEKTYLHRIGRTARAGNTGVAVTFVDWDDLHRWALINKTLDLGIPEPQETYSNSEHLYGDLGIPAEAKGFLRRSEQTRAGLAAEEIEDLGETGKRHGKGGPGGSGGPGRATGSGARGRSGGARREESAEQASNGESRPSRSRNRRRTRGAGAAVAGAATSDAEGSSVEAAAPHGTAEPMPAGTAAVGEDSRPRRRRRRGGSSRSGDATPAQTAAAE
ncbi:DEAD/DEAH box helicase [Intrasporangium calvum]|uniref:RNA helicase n=1 Tax=Intrasporangium calvum (strain ATCC 23552 / DSM 43043 / JCM 3097 / NBRC 12989 / NCIMB 10167 / NRRL B-3866 / 7 KIP) TaxID=710696 RepID=E6S7X5_INTC7|nr:DEAD/DEAH box helicase [Intrasporangium calvum]ADU49071.1 DEAD/DEAH box helicase domain protein [Intrasporangium calvum DSM 43043]AXG14027.1 DEAD/DEAH box helicase [Intrasporangium calvum]